MKSYNFFIKKHLTCFVFAQIILQLPYAFADISSDVRCRDEEAVLNNSTVIDHDRFLTSREYVTILKRALNSVFVYQRKHFELSWTNLKRLNQDFNVNRSTSIDLLTQIKRDAKFIKFFSELRLTHETGISNAQKIVEGGAFLSSVELIRRSMLPPGDLMSGLSKFDVEGTIGEQDVVYMAIRGPGTLDSEANFGDVEFSFDRSKILEAGYFTLSPFDHSPGAMNNDGLDPLAKARGIYRQSLSVGEAALKDVFAFAWVQRYWDSHTPHSALVLESEESISELL